MVLWSADFSPLEGITLLITWSGASWIGEIISIGIPYPRPFPHTLRVFRFAPGEGCLRSKPDGIEMNNGLSRMAAAPPHMTYKLSRFPNT
jgi:hypothetical protein